MIVSLEAQGTSAYNRYTMCPHKSHNKQMLQTNTKREQD